MDTTLLVAEVLRRKLPETKVSPGEHALAGTAIVDLDVTVAKSEPTEVQPGLPWKSIVAALAKTSGLPVAHFVKAAKAACNSDEPIPLPAEVEAALEKVRAKMPPSPKEGPTKVTGTVELVGFAPAELQLPGWREVKAAIAEFRKAG